jgi:phenylpropionate dioxygenase-like ring-hydroxylating dioxygenase large terminal subunit
VATAALPWSWYADAGVLRREQESVFRRFWQYAARADQVAEPGSYVAARAGGLPVVVVRDRAGTLRGFLNVCRHRGSIICDGEGRRETLQCPYHGWTYDLDGSLRAAPRVDRELDFSLDGIALVPVAVETWGPFVFVNPDVEAPPLGEYLGELPAQLAEGGVDVDALRFRTRVESDYEANWKVCAENYLECYHCSIAHPSFSRVIDVSPAAYALRAQRWHMSQFGTPKGVYAGAEVDRGQFHFLFPNTTINVMPGALNLTIGPIVPLAPERTYRSLDYFFGEDVDERGVADYLELDEQVGREDRELVERVQAGVRTGAIERGIMLPQSEQLVVRFEELLLEALDDEAH